MRNTCVVFGKIFDHDNAWALTVSSMAVKMESFRNCNAGMMALEFLCAQYRHLDIGINNNVLVLRRACWPPRKNIKKGQCWNKTGSDSAASLTAPRLNPTMLCPIRLRQLV